MKWFKRKLEETSLYHVVLMILAIIGLIIVVNGAIEGVKSNKELIIKVDSKIEGEVKPEINKNAERINELEKSTIEFDTKLDNVEEKLDVANHKLDKLIDRELNKGD